MITVEYLLETVFLNYYLNALNKEDKSKKITEHIYSVENGGIYFIMDLYYGESIIVYSLIEADKETLTEAIKFIDSVRVLEDDDDDNKEYKEYCENVLAENYLLDTSSYTFKYI